MKYVILKNEDNEIIRNTQFPIKETNVVTIGNSSIKNSDQSYDQEVVAEGDHLIPDINITSNAAALKSVPSAINVAVDVHDTAGADVGSVIANKVVIADTVIKNSDESYSQSERSEDPHTIPDIV